LWILASAQLGICCDDENFENIRAREGNKWRRINDSATENKIQNKATEMGYSFMAFR